MPLNFHGHILAGNARKIMISLKSGQEVAAESGSHWSDTILSIIEINTDLARWCYHRLDLYPVDCFGRSAESIGSAERVVLRTAVLRLVEALYVNWELVIKHISVKAVENAIEELLVIAKISKDEKYPVMLWEYFEEGHEVGWVSRTMAKLPSLETISEFYELPHMRNKFIDMQQHAYCDDNDRSAEKAFHKALAERNKRLNRAMKKQSRRE